MSIVSPFDIGSAIDGGHSLLKKSVQKEELKAVSLRRKPLTQRDLTDMRPVFAVDVDRILHSKTYSRYIDKTQVFYLLKNDHITRRVLHVQIVSRIARTIGQYLNLDLDLIEAASLGHDLGHAPFGHDGEMFLSELCRQAGIEPFVHAVMSLRFLERLEKKGQGLNLTLGVLDAILCHDGESDFSTLTADDCRPTFEELDRRIALRLEDPNAMVQPMTREGCLVRLCDTISYVGRDLEDAIEIGLIERRVLPKDVAAVLGSTNGEIVYRLVQDLIKHSLQDPDKVAFSPEIAGALIELKNFNREHIYFNPKIKTQAPKLQRLYSLLFEALVEDFADGPKLEQTKRFLEPMDSEYLAQVKPEEKTRDFIAGMTDDYFLRLASIILIPESNTDFFS
ncbi:MAG: HD domain-containing protein [Deltaproteobacteria bacterium]|jgi:dGTPase|nr:HD domain-containing protein [Deltaproteobacteria bacterium]